MTWNTASVLAIPAVALLLTGCSVGSKSYYDMNTDLQAERAALADAPPAPMSLFKSDQAVLSNAEIEKIFATRVVPPAKARLAVLRLGTSSAFVAPELVALEKSATDDVLAKFRASPRVSHAMVLPTMLTPTQMTIPYMREAAARLQADTLMVYRTASQIYQRSRAFAADETRAYCTVEGILLDTRSGIVTYTAVATEQFSAKRRSNDLSFRETMQRAEQEAVGKALLKVAGELVTYLDTAPLPGSPTTNATAAAE